MELTRCSVEKHNKTANSPRNSKKLYFIGTAGNGMAPIAYLCNANGYIVIGTDEKGKTATENATCGRVGFMPEEEPIPEDTAAVVYSYAVDKKHPRLREAVIKGIPCFSRAEFLGMLAEQYPVRIAVAGMHGKSSTVGMCCRILCAAEKNPTVISGADLGEGTGGCRLGGKEIFLAETCEYRDAFLSFSPTHAAVLNMEWEHVDYFRTPEAVYTSFHAFMRKESVRYRVFPANEKHFSELATAENVTFGEGSVFRAAKVQEKNGAFSFDLVKNEKTLGRVDLRIPGEYQVANALAAAALCDGVGCPEKAITAGLSSFSGAPRRMEYVGQIAEARVYLDYAHHPTELSASLRTAARMGRVGCIFQAHTYSRAAAFRREFATILRGIPLCGILPIYPARETDMLGISGEIMACDAGATYLPDFTCAADFLRQAAKCADVLLIIGAGDVDRVAEILFPERITGR